MKRIAIFTSNDYTWSFPTWVRTILKLIKQYDIVGIYLFPNKMGKMKGVRITLWYLRIFGLYNFALFGLYSIKARLLQLGSQMRTWRQLALRYNIELNIGQTPNSKVVCDWVRENNIDIILVMVGNILKSDIINSPNIGIINKHAAILPGCRGVFPFFWAKITGSPTGITFHQVDFGIDTGKILLQAKYPSDDSCEISMLRFYIDVFYLFPAMASLAVTRLINKDYCYPGFDVKSSCYSFPTPEDFRRYQNKSCRIAGLSDLFYEPDILISDVVKEIK